MDIGQSISFTSFDSYNYPPNNNLTFHQTQPFNSQYSLNKDSMIKHFPGKKVNLGQNLEVLVLLQTAQIERLTVNLHQYRMKFKRIMNNEKDYNSFKYQANELLQAKDQLEFKNKKIHQYAQNQKGELIDQIKYVQTLENKYRRALKLIEEAHLSKQQLESLNLQQKEQIAEMERTFEAFKQRSIQEYQVLRDQLQRVRNDELAFQIHKFKQQKQRWAQILNKQESKHTSQKQKYETLLQQQRNQMIVVSGELQRIKKQFIEKNQYILQITNNQKKNQEERQKHFVLLGTELQRLNQLLKDKMSQIRQLQSQIEEFTSRLNKKSEQYEGLKRQIERYRNKNNLFQQQLNKQNQQITRLTNNLSSVTNKLHQMGLIMEQKNVQLKLKDKKLAQQIENYSQHFSKAQHYFQKESEECKMINANLVKQIQRIKRQSLAREQSWNKKQIHWQVKVKQFELHKQQLYSNLAKQTKRFNDSQQKYKLQANKLMKDIDILRKKLQESYLQKRNLEQSYRRQQKQLIQSYTRSHQQKWEQLNQRYIKSNEQIKSLFQNKQVLQKTVYSLRNSLEQSQYQKQQLKKCRTFESMIKEIETLCESSLQKDSQIDKLKNEIVTLQEQIRQLKPELQLLRQATIKLINLSNANQSHRRQDNYLLIEQIKKLFIQHSSVTQEIKENTNRIAFNYHKHKQFMESAHSHLIKSKELEISDLRDKIANNQRDSHSNSQLKDIINKIIIITKENTELKVMNSKRNIENQNLSKQIQELKQVINRSSQSFEANIREKDQICKRLMTQLQESNILLLQQRQNEMKLQSSLIILQEEKDKESKETAIKQSIIKQLKASIKAKDQQLQQINSALSEENRVVQTLKHQRRQVAQKCQNYQMTINQKDRQIAQIREKYQQIQHNSQENHIEYEHQIKQLSYQLQQMNEQHLAHTSKLKDQNHRLISQNSDLKQEMIRTGSTILNLSQQNQHLKDYQMRYNSQLTQCKGYKQQIDKLLQSVQQQQMVKYQYQNIKMQHQHCKRQAEQNKKILLNYSQKINLLQNQIKKMEGIIHDFQIKSSLLESDHYQQSLTIQKNKISQQKILVLGEEIDRLQAQRINLIQELNICRLQMSQENTLQRQIKDHHILLVLLFAEIQSLRQTLHNKQRQIDDFRRQSLK